MNDLKSYYNLTILHDILKDAQDKEYEDYTIPTSKKERTNIFEINFSLFIVISFL